MLNNVELTISFYYGRRKGVGLVAASDNHMGDNKGWINASEESLRESIEKAFEEELDKVNAQLESEILFVMIGDVNVGKSSTINALMGSNEASVSAKPGETIKISEIKCKGKDRVIFVDTPGLNDICEENSNETLEYYKKADVVLFMLNAAGTVFSKPEKTNFEKVTAVNKEVILLLNKIDALEDNEIKVQVDFIKEQTNNQYKVIPISSKTGQNIDELRSAVLDFLERKGKDLLFARVMKEKSGTANKYIIGAASSASAIGLAPVPGSDMIPITSVQVGMLIKLAAIYEKPLQKETAKELVLATIVGGLGKNAFRQIVKLVPGAGSVVAAGVAGAMTLALGYAVKYAYENNIELNYANLKAIYALFYKKGKVT
jgi:GTP-binding protein Era